MHSCRVIDEVPALTPASLQPSNAEQVESWNGSGGAYWATHADVYERIGDAYLPALLAAAGIHGSDAVIDVGCGTGATTRAAAAHTTGEVLGVDVSAPMLAGARRRAAGLPNVRFLHADAQAHRFTGEADLVMSRFGVMFFGDPVAAFRNLRAAARPGGRLAMVVWRTLAENAWGSVVTQAFAAGRPIPAPPPGAPGPFALGDPAHVRALLTEAGWSDVTLGAEDHPMWWGASAAAAYEFQVGATKWMLEGFDEDERARALDELKRRLHDLETDDGVLVSSAAWIVTARA